MAGGGQVRLTRGRSKGGEINWNRGHLANFLHSPGWSHPSQMKATTDKSPRCKLQTTDCLQASRERTRCSCNPLSSSSDFTQLCKAWEDGSSHNSRSSPADSRGTTEDSRQSIPGHQRYSPPDITCNFTLFSQKRPKRVLLHIWSMVWYGQCCTAQFTAHTGRATMATWQQT